MSAASLVDLTYVVERVVEAMTAEKARYVIGTAARCIIMFIYLKDTVTFDRALSLILNTSPSVKAFLGPGRDTNKNIETRN